MIYNNEGCKKKINSLSFIIALSDGDLVYTYIRKNACTSFKKLFKSFSPYDFHQAGGDLKGMAHYYKVCSPDQAARAKHRVFVYRDPVERVVSVFKNKFIQKSGADDIIDDFKRVTGLDPDCINFRGYVKDYVAKISSGTHIDAHLLPQQWHLLPIVYNSAIPLHSIKSEMSKILGCEIGEKFFSKPVNSTKANKSVCDRFYGEDKVSDLYALYKSSGVFPSNDALLSDDIVDLIRSIYVDDYHMINALSSKVEL